MSKDTLYLIVYQDIMDRILSGEKITEYRECGEYWDKRIVGKDYSKVNNEWVWKRHPTIYIVTIYGV